MEEKGVSFLDKLTRGALLTLELVNSLPKSSRKEVIKRDETR